MIEVSNQELISQVCHDTRRHRIEWHGNTQDDNLSGEHKNYTVEIDFDIPFVTYLTIKVPGYTTRKLWLSPRNKHQLLDGIHASRHPKEYGVQSILEAMQQ